VVKNANYYQPIDSYTLDEFKIIGTTEAVIVRIMMSYRELEISD